MQDCGLREVKQIRESTNYSDFCPGANFWIMKMGKEVKDKMEVSELRSQRARWRSLWRGGRHIETHKPPPPPIKQNFRNLQTSTLESL